MFGGGDVSDDITLPKGPLLLYDMQKQTMHDTIMCVYRGLVSMGAVGASQSLSKLRVLLVPNQIGDFFSFYTFSNRKYQGMRFKKSTCTQEKNLSTHAFTFLTLPLMSMFSYSNIPVFIETTYENQIFISYPLLDV